MAYKIVYQKRFTATLIKITEYLENEWGDKVARDFFDNVINRIEALKYHPYIGASSHVHKTARGLHLTKHNRLIYTVRGRTVYILNIYDTRQKRYR